MVHGMGMVGAHLRQANHGYGITALLKTTAPVMMAAPSGWGEHRLVGMREGGQLSRFQDWLELRMIAPAWAGSGGRFRNDLLEP